MPPETLLASHILPVSHPPIADGFIRVENGRITAIGRIADLPDSPEKQAYINNPNKTIITPGLINTHCHLEQSFGSRVEKTPDQPMSSWLRRVTERNRAHATPEDLKNRCRRGVQELISTGTTFVNDISGLHGISLEVLEESGLRAVVSPEFFHPAHDPVQIDAVLALYQTLSGQYQNHPRLRVGLSPHTPFNVSPNAWRKILENDPNLLIHTHIAESLDESAWVEGKPSDIATLHRLFVQRDFPPLQPDISPVAYLAQFGLLTSETIAAHLVETNAGDREILKQSGVRIAHCPRSNMFLQNKTLRWPDWENTGIPIGLGTDGHLSTENLDLRAEARTAMALHGWSAEQALRIMTLDGARVMNLDPETGSLEPGKLDDLALWHGPGSLAGLPPEDQALSAETTLNRIMVGGHPITPAGVPA